MIFCLPASEYRTSTRSKEMVQCSAYLFQAQAILQGYETLLHPDLHILCTHTNMLPKFVYIYIYTHKYIYIYVYIYITRSHTHTREALLSVCSLQVLHRQPRSQLIQKTSSCRGAMHLGHSCLSRCVPEPVSLQSEANLNHINPWTSYKIPKPVTIAPRKPGTPENHKPSLHEDLLRAHN